MKHITIQASMVATASLMALATCMSRVSEHRRQATSYDGSAVDESAPDESAPDESPWPSEPAPPPPTAWIITNDESLDEATIERLLANVSVELDGHTIGADPDNEEAPGESDSESHAESHSALSTRRTVHECAHAVREAAAKWAQKNNLKQVAERQFGDNRLHLLYTKVGTPGIYEVSYRVNVREKFAYCKVSYYPASGGPVPATATGLSAGNFKEAVECRR